VLSGTGSGHPSVLALYFGKNRGFIFSTFQYLSLVIKESPVSALAAQIAKGVRHKVYVTRRLHFSAAHRIANPNWSEDQNQATFGLCANPQWHGHNYELEVCLAGYPDPDTGYVYDLSKLKKNVNALVVDKIDHKNLNTQVDFLDGVIPSTENLAIAIWNELKDAVAPAELTCIRLWETPRNMVEYRGETMPVED
jgi:6-pyruvoyltetrahydropterin/6-carboxytetrahydropterin synthase